MGGSGAATTMVKSATSGGVVRADRARALLDLTRSLVGDEGVARLAAACEAKSARLRSLLLSGGGGEAGAEAVREALPHVFPAGRPRRRLGPARWREAAASLAPAVRRLLATGDVAAFGAETAAVLGEAAAAVGADILRFCRPEAAWPWAPWIWDGAGGGLLGHVLADGDSPPADPGRVYAEAGRHLAYLRALWGESVPVDGFSLDAWLAAAFASHAYLVTSASATEELAAFLPSPLELAARLLGVRGPAGAPAEPRAEVGTQAERGTAR